MPDFSLAGLSAPITSLYPADSVLSADGATLYVAGEDGVVRVYDFATRLLQATWDVGTKLGGIDLSPDGSFLVVTEKSIVNFHGEQPFGPFYSTSQVYRVDTATGAATTYAVETQGGDSTFHDVAILADGNLLLSMSAYSAILPLWTLDMDAGQFASTSETFRVRPTLVTSADRSHVVVTPGDISNGPIHVYESGVGITHSNGGDGYNIGISAISLEADLIAQQTLGGGLRIYDASLNFLVDLGALHPGLYLDTNLGGLAFDSTGDNLFILSDVADRIFQVSTADWSIVGTIPVGSNVGMANLGGYGNRLLPVDDGRGFIVTTAAGLRYVEDNRFDNDFTGSDGDDFLFAGDGTDIVAGLAGDDTIGGGTGDDLLHGGGGDDILDPGTGSDIANGGLDSDTLSINWSASATAVHNDLLSYNAGEGGFDGSFTNDAGLDVSFTSIERFEIVGGTTGDYIGAGDGNDVLNGGGGNDQLFGGAGDDTLLGGSGTDAMSGGTGNDRYIVDHAGDTALEGAGDGADIIYSAVSYSLNDGSEVESLSTITWEATTALNLSGNSLANQLIGNAGANQLNGKGGADMMTGREGNDTYLVDNAGDRPIEYSGQGTDTVYTSVSYALAANTHVEGLATISFEATNALNLTGNGLANNMIGNDGANQFDGKAGADTMTGRAGNDKYLVDNAGDRAFEAAGGGTDAVYTGVSFALTDAQEIEGLSTITWELTTAINLTGNGLKNNIIGNAGANVLDGRGGNDSLQGREGADSYAFTTVLGANNIDAILGFSSADDTILLENNGVFVGLAVGALNPNAFVIDTTALDADDRIIYNQATGQLFFDADGSGAGAQIQFAALQGAPLIQANDFTVI